MQLGTHFSRLFSYDVWANLEVYRAMEAGGTVPAKSLKLLAHITAAERLWWDRLEKQPQSVPVWPEWTLAECESNIKDMDGLWRQYLAGKQETDYFVAVSYVNSKGEKFASSPYDILVHVVTHSAHHRGQIALDMRAAGLTPAYTDYIHGVRQGLVE